MNTVQAKVQAKIQRTQPGSVFVTQDFLDFGSRAAVDQSLSRLVRRGVLRTLAAGVFDVPRTHAVLGDLSPDAGDVANAVARKSGSRIQISGAKAANVLGLSTQVPSRQVFLTDGPAKTIPVGNQIIELRHVAPRHFVGNQTVGTVLQALRYLGRDNISGDVITKLRNTLSDRDKSALSKAAPKAAGWIKPIVEKIAAHA